MCLGPGLTFFELDGNTSVCWKLNIAWVDWVDITDVVFGY